MFIWWWLRKYYEIRLDRIYQFGRFIIVGWDGSVDRGGYLNFKIRVMGKLWEVKRPIEMPPMVRITRISRKLVKITIYSNKREESSINGNHLIEDTEMELYEGIFKVKTGCIWRIRKLSR